MNEWALRARRSDIGFVNLIKTNNDTGQSASDSIETLYMLTTGDKY